MRKRITILTVILTFMVNLTAFAAGKASVGFSIDGDFIKGQRVILNVKANDVDRLYSASVDFVYNPEFIKVTSIEGGDFIKTSEDNIMELGGETDKDGNRASYQFTFTGEVDGLTGSGNIAKITMEVLKDGKLDLNEDNMKIKLVKIDSKYNVDYMEFSQDNFSVGKDVGGNNNSTNGSNESSNKPSAGTDNTTNDNKTITSNDGGVNNNEVDNNDLSETEIESSQENSNKETDNVDNENDKDTESDEDNKLDEKNDSNNKLIISAGSIIATIITMAGAIYHKRIR